MDYEKKYKEALERAKKFEEKYGGGYAGYIFPELEESEDERIRKALLKMAKVPRKEIYEQEGITKEQAIAYLEKQKEQKPYEPSDDELERHQKELYDFKVFAAKQAKEHHISFVHDFEWNNFCAELLSYFHEPKPAWSEEDERMLSRCVKSIESSKQFADSDTFKKAKDNEIDWLKNRFKFLHPQAKVELSEEDEDMRNLIIETLDDNSHYFPFKETKKKMMDWLRSLRPSWKPSEEQIYSLGTVVKGSGDCIVGSVGYHLKELYEQLKKLM